jgi:hypothetical protein
VSAAGLDLRVLPGAPAIVRVDPHDESPAWAAPAGPLADAVGALRAVGHRVGDG